MDKRFFKIWFLDQAIWREEHKSKYDFEKIVEECEVTKCRYHIVILCEGLWNQRTTCSSRRRSGKCRSGDSHLEWTPRIMEFIHVRNVCQKEVITFRRLWEEHTQDEAQLIIRKYGSNWRSSAHDSIKITQAWRTQFLKKLLSILSIWVRNDFFMNE